LTSEKLSDQLLHQLLIELLREPIEYPIEEPIDSMKLEDGGLHELLEGGVLELGALLDHSALELEKLLEEL